MSNLDWDPPLDDVDWVDWLESALERYDPSMVTKIKHYEFGTKWGEVGYYCSVCEHCFGSTYEGWNPFKPCVVEHFDVYHSGKETKSANKR